MKHTLEELRALDTRTLVRLYDYGRTPMSESQRDRVQDVLRDRNLFGPDGSVFVWGEVHEHHTVGPYHIIEFTRNRPSNAQPDWQPPVSFHSYVLRPFYDADPSEATHWEDTHHSYHSLDAALVACVVYRNEWRNTDKTAAMNERLTDYIMRILKED